jgi:hypothetical protein
VAASHRTSSGTRTRSRWPRTGVPLKVIQRRLRHANLGITSVYLQGIHNAEVIKTVHARRAPNAAREREASRGTADARSA